MRVVRVLRNGSPPAWAWLLLIIGMVTVFVLIMPIGTLFQVRHEYQDVRSNVALLSRRSQVLGKEITKLNSTKEIEAIAHQRYGLIQPTQQEFVVLPGPKAQSAYGPVPVGSAVPTTTVVKG